MVVEIAEVLQLYGTHNYGSMHVTLTVLLDHQSKGWGWFVCATLCLKSVVCVRKVSVTSILVLSLTPAPIGKVEKYYLAVIPLASLPLPSTSRVTLSTGRFQCSCLRQACQSCAQPLHVLRTPKSSIIPPLSSMFSPFLCFVFPIHFFNYRFLYSISLKICSLST